MGQRSQQRGADTAKEGDGAWGGVLEIGSRGIRLMTIRDPHAVLDEVRGIWRSSRSGENMTYGGRESMKETVLLNTLSIFREGPDAAYVNSKRWRLQRNTLVNKIQKMLRTHRELWGLRPERVLAFATGDLRCTVDLFKDFADVARGRLGLTVFRLAPTLEARLSACGFLTAALNDSQHSDVDHMVTVDMGGSTLDYCLLTRRQDEGEIAKDKTWESTLDGSSMLLKRKMTPDGWQIAAEGSIALGFYRNIWKTILGAILADPSMDARTVVRLAESLCHEHLDSYFSTHGLPFPYNYPAAENDTLSTGWVCWGGTYLARIDKRPLWTRGHLVDLYEADKKEFLASGDSLLAEVRLVEGRGHAWTAPAVYKKDRGLQSALLRLVSLHVAAKLCDVFACQRVFVQRILLRHVVAALHSAGMGSIRRVIKRQERRYLQTKRRARKQREEGLGRSVPAEETVDT
ncbi:unnamed protein product [Vitrella brassicaformis CCMP3155]|uniref:Uncharacterized protein n=1 Tax=Vitrella brassicaformis (strain CCMP3155) TaxID=1169540 RepID=A0A0G4F6E8_VITBC|nr:unnamed protein product [Vitrella brassicaformis CCMP3155]|eukprot:CEM07989.1 unnamed protein product [Vitrella brassicaformis CCMP3155]